MEGKWAEMEVGTQDESSVPTGRGRAQGALCHVRTVRQRQEESPPDAAGGT